MKLTTGRHKGAAALSPRMAAMLRTAVRRGYLEILAGTRNTTPMEVAEMLEEQDDLPLSDSRDTR